MKQHDGLKMTRVTVANLIPHPHNPRQGDVGAIMESMKAHGIYAPIVVQKSSNIIIKGNHTAQAAQLLGYKEIDAVILDVDDDQALRILLADNQTGDQATNNKGVLTDLLESLINSDFGLQGTGFHGDDLDDLVAEFKPEPPEEFPSFDDETETQFKCPKCDYEWNGAPR